MSHKPVPTDANGRRLLDTASEILTGTKVATMTAKNWQFPVDIKGIAAYVSSGTLLIKGTSAACKEFFTAAAAVDAGSGKVQLTIDNSGFVSGDVVTLVGTGVTGYDGAKTLTSGTDTTKIEFVATYSAATIPATAYVTGNQWASLSAGAALDLPSGILPNVTMAQIKTASGTATLVFTAWR